jgi:hypothetical protein
VRLLANVEVELAFREIVRRLLSEEAAAILDAGRGSPEGSATSLWGEAVG